MSNVNIKLVYDADNTYHWRATYTAKSGKQISAIGRTQQTALRNLVRKSPIAGTVPRSWNSKGA